MDAPFIHEGDWEFFQVVTKLSTEDEECQPWSASYSMHYYGVSLPWDGNGTRRVLHDGNTPKIFVAAGSHATYPVNGHWDTPDAHDFEAWREWFNIEDWYPQMYKKADYSFDDAATLTPISYELVPLEAYAIWLGHWGEVDAGEPDWARLTDKDNGPPSPRYRNGAAANMYVNPVEYHNSDNMLSTPEIIVPSD